jgi:hypothetical protein
MRLGIVRSAPHSVNEAREFQRLKTPAFKIIVHFIILTCACDRGYIEERTNVAHSYINVDSLAQFSVRDWEPLATRGLLQEEKYCTMSQIVGRARKGLIVVVYHTAFEM